MPARLIDDMNLEWPVGKGPSWKRNNHGFDGGKFGRIDHIAVVDEKGIPIYDKCIAHEGDHVITVTYGRDHSADGGWRIGLVKEARDTAAPPDGETSLAFWGPPRGFLNVDEDPIAAAKREAGEEAGATVIENAFPLGKAIVNETIVNSWSPIVALQVNLARLSEIAPDHGEKIFKAKYFSLPMVEDMIADGTYDGASTRSMVLMSTVMLFKLCVLPRLQ